MKNINGATPGIAPHLSLLVQKQIWYIKTVDVEPIFSKEILLKIQNWFYFLKIV